MKEPPQLGAIRVIYLGRTFDEPLSFLTQLQGAVSEALGRPVEIERYDQQIAYPLPSETSWPPDVPPIRSGEITLLILAPGPPKCGTPAAAGMMFTLATAGLFPFADEDTLRWDTEGFDEHGSRVMWFHFDVHRAVYGWLPLVPFKPLNMLWRYAKGDAYDQFIHVYPSHLRREVALTTPLHAPRENARVNAGR